MHDVLAEEHVTWYNGGRGDLRCISCMLNTHTRYAHSVCGKPKLKDVDRFRNGSVREPYERSLSEQTFTSEPFIEKHAISTELSNVNREKHKCKSHRVCRRQS